MLPFIIFERTPCTFEAHQLNWLKPLKFYKQIEYMKVIFSDATQNSIKELQSFIIPVTCLQCTKKWPFVLRRSSMGSVVLV